MALQSEPSSRSKMADFAAAMAALGLDKEGEGEGSEDLMAKASQVWQFLDSLATSDPKGVRAWVVCCVCVMCVLYVCV